MFMEFLNKNIEEITRPLNITMFKKDNGYIIDSKSCMYSCIEQMNKNNINKLYVEQDGLIIGDIAIKDILNFFNKEMQLNSLMIQQAFESIQEAVCIINKHGKVILWNEKAENLYGIEKDEIIGKKLQEYFSKSMSDEVLQTLEVVDYIYHSPKEDCHIVISASPIIVNGELVGAISTDRDVSEVRKLKEKLKEANDTIEFLRNEVTTKIKDDFDDVIGNNIEIQKQIKISKQVAKFNIPVLITGESGTGKEVFLRAIHKHSGVKGKFVPVNCSAIPSELFESEFFGYEYGAFTGASKEGKDGYFKLAQLGTVFLDEIGDMPISMQTKLLRVLQEKKIKPVGSDKSINVDFRLVSATNKNLEELIKKGAFREDLYYRLNVVNINIPPLRKRKEDIPLFIEYFLKEICGENNVSLPIIEEDALNELLNYSWPGNVRELRNIMQYLVVLSQDGVVSKDLLPDSILKGKDIVGITSFESDTFDLNQNIELLELDLITKALELSEGNKSKAARLLNIPRTTLHSKLKVYDIK